MQEVETTRRAPGVAESLQKANLLLAGKYLSFMLGKEHFAVPILKVREIIGLLDITPVPQAPGHIRGVINLRGKIIPVVDLRCRFGMQPVEFSERNCIIVVEVLTKGRPVSVGVLVDNVSEVLAIANDDIEPAPDFGVGVDTAFILGMAKAGGKVKILLDIDEVLGSAELSLGA